MTDKDDARARLQMLADWTCWRALAMCLFVMQTDSRGSRDRDLLLYRKQARRDALRIQKGHATRGAPLDWLMVASETGLAGGRRAEAGGLEGGWRGDAPTTTCTCMDGWMRVCAASLTGETADHWRRSFTQEAAAEVGSTR